MGAAQIIIMIMLAIEFGMTLSKHGQSKGVYNIWAYLFDASILIGLLWWGGFWG